MQHSNPLPAALHTQVHKEHMAQPGYGATPYRLRDSGVEECNSFDPANKSCAQRLSLGDVDPNKDLLYS